MASGSFNISRTGGSQYLSFPVFWSSTPNTAGNYSDVVVSVYVDKSSSSTSNTWGTSNTSVSLAGQNQVENGLSFTVVPGGRTLIFAKAYKVSHDSDGKKKITISVDVGGDVMWASGSKEVELDTIPRASSIAVGNYNLGQNISVTIGKKSNSFTSTLTYKIGSRTGTIATKISDSTLVWEMPQDLISLIKQDNPSTKSVSAVIYCETYSGNTKIGDTQSASFTLVIIDKPAITDVVINETIELIKQYTASIVKYLSVPQFNITANPSEGTTISTYKVKINDREISSSTNGLTINNIQYSYLVEDIRKTKFIVTVTDARGNTSEEYPIEMDFIEYVQLAFNNTDITLTRLNGTSNFIKLHLTGYIYNGLIGETQNILTLQYRYKLKNDPSAEWSDLKVIEATLNGDNTFIIDDLQLEDEFDYRKNYDIEFYAQDLFLSEKYETVVKTSETIAKWHKGGLDVKSLTIQKKEVLHENNQKIYKSEEQPIGIWINGKTIYRKVLSGTRAFINSFLTQSELGYETVIRTYGIMYSKFGHWWPIPTYFTNSDYFIATYFTTERIVIEQGANYSDDSEIRLIIEYTKTTDIVDEVDNAI